MGDVEAIVPRVPFVEAWVRLEVTTEGGVEGREELPIGEDRTKQPRLLVIVVLVARSSASEELCILLLAHSTGELAEIPVCDVVLQRVRDGVVELLSQGNVAS